MRYGLWALYYLELYASIANSKNKKKGILKTDSLGGFISALENRRKMAQNDVELEMVAPEMDPIKPDQRITAGGTIGF